MLKLTPEQIVELEAKYDQIAIITAKHEPGQEPRFQCAFRPPDQAEYKRFRSLANQESHKADSQEVLCRACVVYPTRDAFDVLLKRYPGLCEAAAGRVADLIGFAIEEAGK